MTTTAPAPATYAAAILDAAADIIETHGLCQGRYWWRQGADQQSDWTPGTPCCIAGAVSVARGRTTAADVQTTGWQDQDPALRAFAAHLKFGDVHNIYRWNDDPARTIPGVAAALHEAAAAIRSGEITT